MNEYSYAPSTRTEKRTQIKEPDTLTAATKKADPWARVGVLLLVSCDGYI